jgi:hypothetical protein
MDSQRELTTCIGGQIIPKGQIVGRRRADMLNNADCARLAGVDFRGMSGQVSGEMD